MLKIETRLNEDKHSLVVPPPAPSVQKIRNPFYEATELEKAGNRKEAERLYLELLNEQFENPVIHAALGMNYVVAEKNGLAHRLLQYALDNMDRMLEGFKAVGIIPKAEKKAQMDLFLATKRSEIMNAIGTCYKHENNTARAREFFTAAQEGLPINSDIQNNLGTLYINEGKPADALKHLDAAIQAEPDHAQAHWNRSLAYLEMGDYERGWPEYAWGLKANVRMDRNYTKEPLPHWDGTPNKRLVVYGEQGIGDEILFASCLPDLLAVCPNTVFECHKKLHTLFANSFPVLDIYPTREDEILTWPLKPDGSKRYEFDAKVAIGDVPRFFRPNLDSFPGTPYIKPSFGAAERGRTRLASLPKKPNVGISWIGGHKRTRVEVRSIQLEQLLPLLQQDVNWISLQYTPCEEEINQLHARHGVKVHHWSEFTHSPNYDDTAGLVANLDLVITVCTSLVHLAGSMGVPTWVMTPSRPAWRYRLDLDHLPWYSSVTLFRQQPDTVNWQPVIEEVSENLADLLRGIHHGTQASDQAGNDTDQTLRP